MASSRRAWFASFTVRAMQRSSSASKSSRTPIAALILVPPNQSIRAEMNHTAAPIAKSQPFRRLVLVGLFPCNEELGTMGSFGNVLRSLFRSAPAPLRVAVRSLVGPGTMQALRGRQRPFMTVRLSDNGRGQFLACRSQLDRDAFSEKLGRASRATGGSRLLDAVRYVLQFELYQAACAFFDWIHRPGPDAKAVVFSGPGERPFSGYLDHPVIDMCGGAERNSAQRGRD